MLARPGGGRGVEMSRQRLMVRVAGGRRGHGLTGLLKCPWAHRGSFQESISKFFFIFSDTVKQRKVFQKDSNAKHFPLQLDICAPCNTQHTHTQEQELTSAGRASRVAREGLFFLFFFFSKKPESAGCEV